MEILAWKFAEIRDMALSAPGPERPLYQTALALLHYRGLAPGQGRDSQTALSLARQAASKGFSPAMNLGAAIAREGEGSFLGLAGSGPAESFNLSRKAAEAGDLLAMGNLSCLYRLGLGVEADIMRAASWAYKAATRPEPLARAMNELGLHYQEGRALSRDEREAARWYGLAAKMGYALAVRNLSGLKSKSGGPPGLDDSIEY
jgi:TPR repeat protein